jgi:excisionase family DNA binding protein
MAKAPPPADIAPLAVRPADACRLLAIGNTRLYQLLEMGELESYFDGRARKILLSSIKDYIRRRMRLQLQAPPPRRPRGRPRKVTQLELQA